LLSTADRSFPRATSLECRDMRRSTALLHNCETCRCLACRPHLVFSCAVERDHSNIHCDYCRFATAEVGSSLTCADVVTSTFKFGRNAGVNRCCPTPARPGSRFLLTFLRQAGAAQRIGKRAAALVLAACGGRAARRVTQRRMQAVIARRGCACTVGARADLVV
jgi:hypothetical protein